MAAAPLDASCMRYACFVMSWMSLLYLQRPFCNTYPLSAALTCFTSHFWNSLPPRVKLPPHSLAAIAGRLCVKESSCCLICARAKLPLHSGNNGYKTTWCYRALHPFHMNFPPSPVALLVPANSYAITFIKPFTTRDQFTSVLIFFQPDLPILYFALPQANKKAEARASAFCIE